MNELPDWAQRLLAETLVAHLGLLDEQGHPRVQPITFARVQDALWTAIDDKPKRRTPARIARLQADPRATITVDRYDDDWTQLAWVQVLGTATIEPLPGLPRAAAARAADPAHAEPDAVLAGFSHSALLTRLAAW